MYKPVKGSILSDEQAERYGAHIAGLIEEQAGGTTEELILSDAKSPRSPLHEWFEWDDTIAADKYRITQARYLVRSINVTINHPDGTEDEVRAFYHVTVTDRETEQTDRLVVTLDRVMTEAELRAQVIEEALKQLQAWRRKYEQYSEFAGIIRAIEALE